jgi:hypothetical protein
LFCIDSFGERVCNLLPCGTLIVILVTSIYT